MCILLFPGIIFQIYVWDATFHMKILFLLIIQSTNINNKIIIVHLKAPFQKIYNYFTRLDIGVFVFG